MSCTAASLERATGGRREVYSPVEARLLAAGCALDPLPHKNAEFQWDHYT